MLGKWRLHLLHSHTAVSFFVATEQWLIFYLGIQKPHRDVTVILRALWEWWIEDSLMNKTRDLSTSNRNVSLLISFQSVSMRHLLLSVICTWLGVKMSKYIIIYCIQLTVVYDTNISRYLTWNICLNIEPLCYSAVAVSTSFNMKCNKDLSWWPTGIFCYCNLSIYSWVHGSNHLD